MVFPPAPRRVYKRILGYNNLMPRPKVQSDEQVLDAALALLHKNGTAALTFAALANLSGLSAATLVQRFGSKTELTQRVLLHAWDRLDTRTRELAAAVPKTPDGAVELLIGLSQRDADIGSYGDGLLVLREDLRDPVVRRRGAAWRTALTAALDECFRSLPGAPAGIGYALAAHWQGAQIWWAFAPDRPIAEYLAESLRQAISIMLPSATTPS